MSTTAPLRGYVRKNYRSSKRSDSLHDRKCTTADYEFAKKKFGPREEEDMRKITVKYTWLVINWRRWILFVKTQIQFMRNWAGFGIVIFHLFIW